MLCDVSKNNLTNCKTKISWYLNPITHRIRYVHCTPVKSRVSVQPPLSSPSSLTTSSPSQSPASGQWLGYTHRIPRCKADQSRITCLECNISCFPVTTASVDSLITLPVEISPCQINTSDYIANTSLCTWGPESSPYCCFFFFFLTLPPRHGPWGQGQQAAGMTNAGWFTFKKIFCCWPAYFTALVRLEILWYARHCYRHILNRSRHSFSPWLPSPLDIY